MMRSAPKESEASSGDLSSGGLSKSLTYPPCQSHNAAGPAPPHSRRCRTPKPTLSLAIHSACRFAAAGKSHGSALFLLLRGQHRLVFFGQRDHAEGVLGANFLIAVLKSFDSFPDLLGRIDECRVVEHLLRGVYQDLHG